MSTLTTYQIFFDFDDEIRDYVYDNFDVTDTGLDTRTDEYEMMFTCLTSEYISFVKIFSEKLNNYDAPV